jgi:hypothetical protein
LFLSSGALQEKLGKTIDVGIEEVVMGTIVEFSDL